MLKVKNASLHYENQLIFSDLSFEVHQGQWLAIMGPSGVGKTSLLRLIAGLHVGRPEHHTKISGTVLVNEAVKYQVAYMAQNDGLLPWRTVLDNVLLPFDLHPDDNRQTKKAEALALLEQVKLSKSLKTKPAKLSGGMRQRVALARTLIQHRDLILMDEPFSALDAMTRMEMQGLTYQLLREANKTVLLVTHDPWEALRLADKVIMLSGQPAEISKEVALPASSVVRDITDPKVVKIYKELIASLS